MGRVAIPGPRGSPGVAPRGDDRQLVGGAWSGAVPARLAVRADAHAPGVQRQRGVLLALLRRPGDRTGPGPGGPRTLRRRSGTASDPSHRRVVRGERPARPAGASG